MAAGIIFQKLQELSAILALILRDHLMELPSFEEELRSLKIDDIKNMMEKYEDGQEEMMASAKNQLTGRVKILWEKEWKCRILTLKKLSKLCCKQSS